MTTIRVPPGVVRGETRAMVPGRWHDTNLVRWQNSVMKPVGGWERANAEAFLSIPRAGHAWLDVNMLKFHGFICDGHVYVEREGNYFNITPHDFVDANSTAAMGYGSGRHGIGDHGMDDEDRGSGEGTEDMLGYIRFAIDNWANELIFSSSADGRVWTWNPATYNPGDPNADPPVPPTVGPPVVALNAPTMVQDVMTTDERHLMTFGGAGKMNRVAWSDRENRTGWDYTNVVGQAGFYDLEGAGKIITAEKVPGGILIFTSTSVWLGRYLGAPYYYGFNRIAEGCVPISAHAVAVSGAKAYWFGRRSFWKYEGGVVTPHYSTLGLEPFEGIDQAASQRRVTAGTNGAYPEVWYFYPTASGDSPVLTENDRYIVFNYEENWWADGKLSRSFFTSSSLDDYPIAGDERGWIYQHEQGYLAEGQPRGDTVFATLGTISFDDGAHNWQVNQAQIDSALGPDSVKFSFEGRYSRGPGMFHLQDAVPRPDGYLDLHFTAKDFMMKITGLKDGPWGLGAFIFQDPKMRGPV